MKITTAGVHMELGDALQSHVADKAAVLAHHFEKVNSVHAAFVQDGHHHHLHEAELTVKANGVMLHASGHGVDWYGALDEATAKLVRQLEKYKGRLGKHRERRAQFKEHLKDLGPLALEDHLVEDETLEGFPTDLFAEFAPKVAKKEVSEIAPMSIDEAVMQMDLLHKPAFLFKNAQTGVLNMVYREGEGAVRWVAPKAA
jgi:putative sigma-54 modulation protein